ncbi:hypothetical protein [Insolitispirillum peregrinum]|uniref:Uncharacterized protein n=1 Tax=Insolitispirillum peregrinum TaxID=80876 RepID=A0A1N7JBW0_9PROT|nr:hypothetical protein [Insolitispirillum peregrinum]SIS46777.1 hypothetical protein SAMN05421779_10273 [Insolitispirillum peregrinum]
MSLDFQNSNAMVSAVRPAARARRTSKTSRVRSRDQEDWDFAGLLAGQTVEEEAIPEVLRGVPGLGLNLPLDPSVFMQQLYGREFDPLTGRVNHGVFLQQTQDKTAQLASDLQQALTGLGADPETPVPLMVDELGNVVVDDDSTPHAEQINALFADNFDLSQSYRDVSQAHHWAALTEIGSAYVEAWYGTEDFDIRDDITDQFRDIFDSLAETASHMSYGNGALDSKSVSMALQSLEALAQ